MTLSQGDDDSTASSPPPSVLRRILEETRAEIERRKRDLPLEVLEAQIAVSRPAVSREEPQSSHNDDPRSTEVATKSTNGTPGRFHSALAAPGIGVIAEFKRRSPSAGRLRERSDVVEIVGAYERAGASALSILTEEPNFEGSLDDVRAARTACGLPILRKDFILDLYQLYEARAAGADAVLLIVAALHSDELATLHEIATSGLGLDVLVEVHDRDELARAASVGATLIGVNNRDLRDFSVDVKRTSELLADMPAGTIVVSESGIALPEQLRELEREGVSAVLVGESLMRAFDPQTALAELLTGSSSSHSASTISIAPSVSGGGSHQPDSDDPAKGSARL